MRLIRRRFFAIFVAQFRFVPLAFIRVIVTRQFHRAVRQCRFFLTFQQPGFVQPFLRWVIRRPTVIGNSAEFQQKFLPIFIKDVRVVIGDVVVFGNVHRFIQKFIPLIVGHLAFFIQKFIRDVIVFGHVDFFLPQFIPRLFPQLFASLFRKQRRRMWWK